MGAYISYSSEIGGWALIEAWALKRMNTVFKVITQLLSILIQKNNKRSLIWDYFFAQFNLFWQFKELKIEGYILSVNEKLPVSKFLYFEKYIIQLFGYCYFYVSSQ